MVRAFICQIAPDQTSDIKIKISGSELPQMLDVFTVPIIFTIDFILITTFCTFSDSKPYPKDATQHEVEQ